MTAPADGRCPSERQVIVHGVRRMVPCSSRSCAVCGRLWLGDVHVKTLAAMEGLTGAVALVTITAPGRDLLPWDSTGSRVEAVAAREWNADATDRWSALHREAARDARYWRDKLGGDWRVLLKCWEYQKRGVLHLHVVVPFATHAERRASTAYVDRLHARARAHGFGFVDRGKLPVSGARRSSRKLEPVEPHRAAAYLAAYVAGRVGGKEGIAEVAARQEVRGPALYVAQALTDRSGITMRTLRARRRVHGRFPGADASMEAWRAACAVDGAEAGRPPFLPERRRDLHGLLLASGRATVVDNATGEVLPPTAAAPPGVLRGGASKIAARAKGAVVRLDLVPHRGPSGDSGQAWFTSARVVLG